MSSERPTTENATPKAGGASAGRTGPAPSGSQIRQEIEKQREKREVEHEKAALVQRLDYAKAGIQALARESYAEAMKSFLVYLALAERAKNVAPGKLHPSQFDVKTEAVELVLITGIYWDLARTYDRMRGKENQRQMKAFLGQFVVFARGASYQALCTETLRKYLAAEKAIHRGDFRAAYKQLGKSTCFIASSLLDLADLETLPKLRHFRDESLARHAPGRAFIRCYERSSPVMAGLLDRAPSFVRRGAARVVDSLAAILVR